ncbi:hypothetical protein U9M48_032675 [Paspalum notatum var. saurae]|uniref:Uncharacterized protein n=1 Tax=Paspalum notatum var. saurae TaxID=547442 RepID=A0AAQ3X5N3_PASNO
MFGVGWIRPPPPLGPLVPLPPPASFPPQSSGARHSSSEGIVAEMLTTFATGPTPGFVIPWRNRAHCSTRGSFFGVGMSAGGTFVRPLSFLRMSSKKDLEDGQVAGVDELLCTGTENNVLPSWRATY